MTLNATHLLDHLRRLMTPAAASDGDLLARFARQRDHSAFTALVARHGPMVHNVCCRLLGNVHAAEDAFQGVFVVLARKAGSVGRGTSLAAWLHGVAARVALNARRAARRDMVRQEPDAVAAVPDSHPDPLSQLTVRELLTALEEEVQRLPRAYRLPVALCCLEGLSQQQAAQRLGWTVGAVKGGLERGRARLRTRLIQRGLTPLGAMAVLEAARGSLRAGLPAGQVEQTVQIALTVTGSVPGRPTTVPAVVVRLAEHVLKGEAMFKRRMGLVLTLLLGLTALGAGALGTLAGPGKQDADPKRPPMQVAVDLKDGSRVVGQAVGLKELLLRTSFGEVRIPIEQVASLQLKDEQGTSVIRFHNGDQLTGLLDLKALGDLKVATALGETAVPLKLVSLCKLEAPPFRPKVAVRASSTGDGTDPHDPFERGDRISRWNSCVYAPAWIEADLGAPRKLHSICLVVAQLPKGETVHELWVSNEPMGDNRPAGTLVHTFRGETDNADELKYTFAGNVSARYVQIRTVQSPSWVGWSKIDLLVR
jgi:RNA polymerase sigma factor (sigma-70 family)